MLTMFSVPKAFQGHISIIQRNAIRSWTQLRPHCEIVLFGNEQGTAEAAREFGLRHVSEIAHNEYGTPLLHDVFTKAQNLAAYDLLCYVNADIMLTGDIIRSTRYVANKKRKFLIVGQRWNVNLDRPWAFSYDWEARLCAYVRERGELFSRAAIDYFIFPRGLFGTIPPFAIGRTAWDNWLIYRARKNMAAVVDATELIMAIHLNHEYGNFPGREALWNSQEARSNRALMGPGAFILDDATHVLRRDGLHFAWAMRQLPWHLRRLSILFPRSRVLLCSSAHVLDRLLGCSRLRMAIRAVLRRERGARESNKALHERGLECP